jgi:hypothetical protein
VADYRIVGISSRRDNSQNSDESMYFVGWVKVFRSPTTVEFSAKRDENGNTNNVEFHPNPPFHRSGHTGGGAAEDLDPPYKFETRPGTLAYPKRG